MGVHFNDAFSNITLGLSGAFESVGSHLGHGRLEVFGGLLYLKINVFKLESNS